MKRVILILITIFFAQFAHAEQTALVPVLEGSIVVDEYVEENAPEYTDFIELEAPEEYYFKSDILKNVQSFNMKANNGTDETYYENGAFSIVGKSRKGHDVETLVSNLRQITELKYNTKFFELSSGYQSKYQTANAENSSQSLFLNPKIKFGRFSVAFGNYATPRSREFYQEIGLNYKSKFLKDASFNILGGTTLKEGEISSQRLRFTTDFYLK